MKKIALLCLFMSPWICARSDQEEIIDHSVNLTATYEFTTGGKLVFDLDQLSRIGSMLTVVGYCRNNTSNLCLGLGCKAIANIMMANKEFDRDELARGYEHLNFNLIAFSSWHILLTKKQAHDRKFISHIFNSMSIFGAILSYPIVEPFLFIRDLTRGNYPISWE